MGLLFQLDGMLFGFLLLSSTSVFQISSSSEWTEFYFPTFAKPCSLAAINTDGKISISNTTYATTKLLMKKLLNSGTLAVMLLGIGPFALLFWSLGVSGEIVFTLWVVAGIIIKLTMGSKK